MRITLAVFNAPEHFRGVAKAAFLFAKAALSQHHEISQIFFYRSGVLNAKNDNGSALPWHELGVTLKVCRTTAIEFGLLESHLDPAFELSTLTEFFSDTFTADKYVIFAE